MGSPLTNTTPAASYKDLLHLDNSGAGATTSLRILTDGNGKDCAVQVSTTGLKATSGFYIENKRVVVGTGGMLATAHSPMATSGANINFAAPTSGVANSRLDAVTIGHHGIKYHNLGRRASAFTLNHESGNVHRVELNGSTVAASFSDLGMITDRYASAPVSYKVRLHAVQDSTGNRSITWPASLKWPASTAPTLTSTAAKVDIFEFETIDYGVTWYGNTIGLNY